MTPFYRRPITRKKVAIALAIPTVLLGVPALGILAWNARPLDLAREFEVKTPAAPAPNAHDFYRDAFESIGANSRPRPPQFYSDDSELRAPNGQMRAYPVAANRAWIARNREGFALFERGLKASYWLPPQRGAQNQTYDTPWFLRHLAKYVGVEAQTLAAQNQRAAAARRALDIWQMGIEAGRGASVRSAGEGYLAETVARHALDSEIAHLDGAQAAQLATRLEKLAAQRVPYAAIVRAERDSFLFEIKPGLEKSAYQSGREKEIDAALKSGQEVAPRATSIPILSGPLVNWQVRRTATSYARGMEVLLENAGTPWSKRALQLPAVTDEKTAKILNVLGKSRFFDARARAFTQLTLARLALHAYHENNGVYPSSLQQLAPKYLAQTPVDAFADDRPLRFERRGNSYQLWSIGPDGVDNEARPILYATARTTAAKHLVSAEGQGDIVASINR